MSIYAPVGLVHEDNPYLPDNCKRIVLEFAMRDENLRHNYEREFRYMDLPVTSSVCNGKFHGMRTLTSFWHKDLERVCNTVVGVKSSLSEPFFDARICPRTPDQTDYPFRVLKYMSEGSKHHSCEELETHCAMSVLFNGSIQEMAELVESLQRVSNCYRIEDDPSENGYFLTATMGGWKKYLCDQAMINAATGRTPSPVYERVLDYFYRFYPKPTVGIPINPNAERDEPWRK